MADEFKKVEQQNSQDGNNPSCSMQSDRRSFLKIGVALGAVIVAAPAFSITNSGERASTGHNNTGGLKITKKRTLGSGQYKMEVSAIGLGCMGMSYHRGHIPD